MAVGLHSLLLQVPHKGMARLGGQNVGQEVCIEEDPLQQSECNETHPWNCVTQHMCGNGRKCWTLCRSELLQNNFKNQNNFTAVSSENAPYSIECLASTVHTSQLVGTVTRPWACTHQLSSHTWLRSTMPLNMRPGWRSCRKVSRCMRSFSASSSRVWIQPLSRLMLRRDLM